MNKHGTVQESRNLKFTLNLIINLVPLHTPTNHHGASYNEKLKTRKIREVRQTHYSIRMKN